MADAERTYFDKAYDRAYALALCHYSSANRYRTYRYRLGVPMIILTGLTTTGVGFDVPSLLEFVEQNGEVDTTWSILIRVIMTVVSLTAGILGTFMSFFDFPSRMRDHHETGVQYSILLRRLEDVFDTRDLTEERAAEIRKELSEMEQKILLSSPPIPGRTEDVVRTRISNERRDAGGRLPEPEKHFPMLGRGRNKK